MSYDLRFSTDIFIPVVVNILTLFTILFNNKELEGVTGLCQRPSKSVLLISSRNGGSISTKNEITYRIQDVLLGRKERLK